MKNQIYTGTPTSRRFALCPTTVVAGDAVLLGSIPAFALNSYSALTGGTVFCSNGTFTASVVGQRYLSPPVSAVIKPGDPLAAIGTLDATTNVVTGLTIFSGVGAPWTETGPNSGVFPFGVLDPSYTSVTSGATDPVAQVKI